MKKLLICLSLSALILSGCSFKLQTSEDVIKVNGQAITKSEFDKAFVNSIDNSFMKNFGGAKNLDLDTNSPAIAMFKEKVAKELIIKTLLDQEMEKRNINVTDEDFKNELKLIIDKVGSKEELNKILKDKHVSNKKFKEDLTTQIKIKKLVDSVEKVNISDKETKKYYDTHKNEFVRPEQVRASHILISANVLEKIQDIKSKNKDISTEDLNKKVDEYMLEQEKKAKKVLEEVKANPDKFDTLARKYSDDKGSAEQGGELGFFSKDVMVPEFSKVAFAMRPNTISETVVKTPYGYHIIKVTDRTEAGIMPYEKVKDELKYYLETKKHVDVLKKITEAALDSAKIEYLNDKYNPEKGFAAVIDDNTGNNK